MQTGCVANIVATINTVIFSFYLSFRPYFSRTSDFVEIWGLKVGRAFCNKKSVEVFDFRWCLLFTIYTNSIKVMSFLFFIIAKVNMQYFYFGPIFTYLLRIFNIMSSTVFSSKSIIFRMNLLYFRIWSKL